MKGSNKKSSGVEETKNQEESKDKEELAPSNQDQPESALQNLVETGEDGGPIKKVTGYATLKDLAMLARVNKKFQSAMNKEIEQRLSRIELISVGETHTLLLAKTKQGQNKLYACGNNFHGQLGLGHTTKRSEWTEVPSPKEFTIEEVMAGGSHSFLKGKGKDGEDKLYGCGLNHVGQLGLGDEQRRKKWTEVPLPDGFTIEKVITRGAHTFLKGTVGGEDKLYASGGNDKGQLGLGNNENRSEWTEVPLPDGFTIEKMISGGERSFLKGKGKKGEDKIYACGYNQDGQLGLGDFTGRNEWTEVDIPKGFRLDKVLVGWLHSFLKGTVGGQDKLYACGRNLERQFGLGDGNSRNEWTEVPVPKDFTIEKVMAGGSHSFLKGKGKDGEAKLYAVGYNKTGQLGLGDNENKREWTEVSLPQGFRLEKIIARGCNTFLKGKGERGEDKLYACGWNRCGELGLGDTTKRNEFTEVPLRNILLKSLVSQEEASMNKKRSGGK